MRPTMPVLLASSVVWAVLTWMLLNRRMWLAFYVTGAFGFTVLVVFSAMALGWDLRFESMQAVLVARLAPRFGIVVEHLGDRGLGIKGPEGWSVFDIGLECSALLEASALSGLVLFYPAFSTGRKVWTALVGLLASYMINVARILIIVAIITSFGTAWVFPAHAIFGRIFYFAAMMAVFWFLVTMPTVRFVSDRMEADGS
ncbi:MAG: hypothetical protein WC971_05865 [Coriobacteriia bacterium]